MSVPTVTISRPREKTYYNINIASNPSPGEFESDAKFSVLFQQPLIDDVGKYQLLVEKFKIDSESIPLFHIDILRPQPLVIQNMNFITNYHIYLLFMGNVYTAPILFSAPFSKPARIVDTVTTGVYYDSIEH